MRSMVCCCSFITFFLALIGFGLEVMVPFCFWELESLIKVFEDPFAYLDSPEKGSAA
jgi:hypothetical protein